MGGNGNGVVGKNGNGNEVLDWEWEWDGNGNDCTGMGGNSRTPLIYSTAHSLTALPRSTQSSILTGPSNCDGECRRYQPTGGLVAKSVGLV